jgi:hypothetical protein
MNIEESIKRAMARMIERKQEITDVEVTSWEEEFDVYSYGGCETCGPEYDKEYSVWIYYNWENSRRSYIYNGKFTDLIKELDTDD